MAVNRNFRTCPATGLLFHEPAEKLMRARREQLRAAIRAANRIDWASRARSRRRGPGSGRGKPATTSSSSAAPCHFLA